jgi:hypothetical protein
MAGVEHGIATRTEEGVSWRKRDFTELSEKWESVLRSEKAYLLLELH